MTNINYDYIIYPANLTGIATAALKTRISKKVLLLNKYGFPGGKITSAFSLLQKGDSLSGLAAAMKRLITSGKKSILAEINGCLLLNPESVKSGLFSFLEASNFDILFHTIPISFSHLSNELLLSSKEGLVKLNAGSFIDCSEDYSVVGSVNNRITGDACFNLFTSYLSDDAILENEIIIDYVKLKDKRVWLSLNIPHSTSLPFHENYSQEIINEIEGLLLASGSRVNLAAPESIIDYKIENCYVADNFYHIDHLLYSNFGKDEAFLKAESIEQIIRNQ